MSNTKKGITLQKQFSDTAKAVNSSARTISLGNIIGGLGDTKKPLSIDVNSFNKHALICGVTGSGKSNTCFSILQQLWHHEIPFLVIAPTKSEYRQLMLQSPIFKGVGRVYTLGNENFAPFQLNPFEVPEGVNVQAHIDALMPIFNASFEMYSPMPQVLNKAIHNLYGIHGWDLTLNKNMRLPADMNPGDENCFDGIYPTLSELYELIEPTVESFGYSDSIELDVKAALLARIGNLIAGAKGEMFGRKCSLAPETLFSQPIVLELQEIFNDTEKAFIAGTLLLYLYHYRKLRGPNSDLQHVLLIDDAHRLLNKDVKDRQNQPGGAFVHIFRDVLSEVGAYGQGIILSAQTPASLVSEALSNTNLKLIHRLLTDADVSAIEGPHYLNDFHNRHIATLATGQAVFYAENMPLPYNLQIGHEVPLLSPVERARIRTSNTVLSETMKSFITDDSNQEDGEETDVMVRSCARLVADDPAFRQVYNRYILSTLNDLHQLVHFRAQVIHEVQRITGGRAKAENTAAITWAAIVLATGRYFQGKGHENYWVYSQVQEQQRAWLDMLRAAFQPTKAGRRLPIEALKQWRESFLELHKRHQGPLPTCGPCKAKCVYRFEVNEVVSDPRIRIDFNASICREGVSASDSAAWFCRLLTERLIGNSDVDLSYCLAVHLIKDQQLSTDAQLILLHKVRTAFEQFDSESGITNA